MSNDWKSEGVADAARKLLDEPDPQDPNRKLARAYAKLFLEARRFALSVAPFSAFESKVFDAAVARERLGPLFDRAVELRAKGCASPDVERGLRSDFPAANDDDLDAAVFQACCLSPNQARSCLAQDSQETS